MRHLTRFVVLVAVLSLAVGPVLAAAPVVRAGVALGTSDAGPSPWRAALEALTVLAIGGSIHHIKDTATLAKKFVSRAGAAQGDYTSGVQVAGGAWETNAKNAESSFEQGVTQSIADKRFGKGIARVGGAKFVQRASTLGAQRYGPGVAAAENDWAKGTQPYLDRLKSLDLPPRGPRRSPANQQRANAVAVALGALKTGK